MGCALIVKEDNSDKQGDKHKPQTLKSFIEAHMLVSKQLRTSRAKH
jgi:hypothetical protein